jgi:creatine kinase
MTGLTVSFASKGLDIKVSSVDRGLIRATVVVNYVKPGSAAANAGVKVGDVVTAVNTASLDSMGIHNDAELATHLKSCKRPVVIDFNFGATAVVTKSNMPTNFRDHGQSSTSKYLTAAMYEKYANVVGPRGYTFDMAIQCGYDGRSGTGMAIPDEQSYYLWQEWYDLLIEKVHGHKPGARHITDTDYTKIDTSKLPADLDKYCISTRIRAARNISGLALPPASSRAERREVETLCKAALNGLTGELKGKYYSLSSMTSAEEQQLQDDHFLFQKPDPNAMIFACGGVRDWPDARGIYHNDSKEFLVWVNEEDQMRVISMQKGGNVPQVFARWAKGVNEVEKAINKKGKVYMYDDHLGQFSSCVSNVGTGLRASMHILLPKIIEQIGQDGLEKLCWDKLEMQCRGTGGEHTKAVGGRVDISNQKRIGKTEVQLVQIMTDGVCKLIELEKLAEQKKDIKPIVAKLKPVA